MDWERDRLLHWISEPKLNHVEWTYHRNGDFYSLIEQEFYAVRATLRSDSHRISIAITPNPLTFHYQSDTHGTPQFGLIAEQVATVNPDLVCVKKMGKSMRFVMKPPCCCQRGSREGRT
jgi:hypothetical protein